MNMLYLKSNYYTHFKSIQTSDLKLKIPAHRFFNIKVKSVVFTRKREIDLKIRRTAAYATRQRTSRTLLSQNIRTNLYLK